MSEETLEEIVDHLHSIALVHITEGCTPGDFLKHYTKLYGPVPHVERFGYSNLVDLLRSRGDLFCMRGGKWFGREIAATADVINEIKASKGSRGFSGARGARGSGITRNSYYPPPPANFRPQPAEYPRGGGGFTSSFGRPPLIASAPVSHFREFASGGGAESGRYNNSFSSNPLDNARLPRQPTNSFASQHSDRTELVNRDYSSEFNRQDHLLPTAPAPLLRQSQNNGDSSWRGPPGLEDRFGAPPGIPEPPVVRECLPDFDDEMENGARNTTFGSSFGNIDAQSQKTKMSSTDAMRAIEKLFESKPSPLSIPDVEHYLSQTASGKQIVKAIMSKGGMVTFINKHIRKIPRLYMRERNGVPFLYGDGPCDDGGSVVSDDSSINRQADGSVPQNIIGRSGPAELPMEPENNLIELKQKYFEQWLGVYHEIWTYMNVHLGGVGAEILLDQLKRVFTEFSADFWKNLVRVLESETERKGLGLCFEVIFEPATSLRGLSVAPNNEAVRHYELFIRLPENPQMAPFYDYPPPPPPPTSPTMDMHDRQMDERNRASSASESYSSHSVGAAGQGLSFANAPYPAHVSSHVDPSDGNRPSSSTAHVNEPYLPYPPDHEWIRNPNLMREAENVQCHVIRMRGLNDFYILLEKDFEDMRRLQDLLRNEWHEPSVQQDAKWEPGMGAIYRDTAGAGDLFYRARVLSQAFRKEGHTVVTVFLPDEGGEEKHVLASSLFPIPEYIGKAEALALRVCTRKFVVDNQHTYEQLLSTVREELKDPANEFFVEETEGFLDGKCIASFLLKTPRGVRRLPNLFMKKGAIRYVQ